MTNRTTLSADLEQLEQKWDTITDRPREPRSTMDVIEYGLGNQQRAEVYINRLLCYLLDPTNPHGMGTDFLSVFLATLPESLDFVEDTYDLSEVRVQEQVTVESEDSRGYADLLVDVPGEWFLLVELKFSAAETGTRFYAQAPHIDGDPVESYESGRYYLYLHQNDEPPASSATFENWTWQSFVEETLDKLIRDQAPRYPQRTTTQLYDLKDDLESITNMRDEQTTDQEKIALFLEHADAITDVTEAFDDAWESYSTDWDRRLATRLTNADIGIKRQQGEVHPEILVARDADDERWIFRATGGDWQHLHRFGWYRHEETLEPLTTRASDKNDLRIGFYFRLEKHRSDAVQDHNLQFNFRNMGSNPSDFKDLYAEEFYAREDTIRPLLKGTKGSLTGNKLTTIKATYDIPVTQHDDFFEAYTAALQEAFIDFVVDNPQLIQTLGETFDAALEKHR